MIALAPPLLRPLVITPHGQYGVPRPKRKGTHYGVDFQATKGDPVVSSTDGVVARTGFDKPVKEGGGGGGNYVIVRTGDYEIGYMHLDRIIVATGQPVGVGTILGHAGDTGAETSGTHLHFQVKEQGHPQDPTTWFRTAAGAAAAGGLLLVGLVVGGYFVWRWLFPSEEAAA